MAIPSTPNPERAGHAREALREPTLARSLRALREIIDDESAGGPSAELDDLADRLRGFSDAAVSALEDAGPETPEGYEWVRAAPRCGEEPGLRLVSRLGVCFADR